ncbi:MAG: NADH:ubiquinone oxidoreductase subunit J [Nitrospirales bacterium]|nr:MAG: NADH:ubiquinone oxidoreductase subunit J [Nitrospirales bacterium]
MIISFYIIAAVAIVATIMVITRFNAIHALLYLIVSLLAVSMIFFLFGAPFAAALEVIIYAGAVMVLFVFVIMMLDMGREGLQLEQAWFNPKMWMGPMVLALILVVALLDIVLDGSTTRTSNVMLIGPQQVSEKLFHLYVIGVELASFLLLPGLISAYHLGRKARSGEVS